MAIISPLRACLAIIALLAVAACGPGPADDTPDLEKQASGVWGTKAERSAFLELSDGKVTGSDGCNGLRGTYEVRDDRLEFSMKAQTLMACPGVDSWLAKLSSARVDGDTLTVYDRDDNEIGTLDRSE